MITWWASTGVGIVLLSLGVDVVSPHPGLVELGRVCSDVAARPAPAPEREPRRGGRGESAARDGVREAGDGAAGLERDVPLARVSPAADTP